MTLSEKHPWVFICSIIYYGAFFHASFSSDALLLKSGTQAQCKDSSFCPHTNKLNIFSIIYYLTHLSILSIIFLNKKKKETKKTFNKIKLTLTFKKKNISVGAKTWAFALGLSPTLY